MNTISLLLNIFIYTIIEKMLKTKYLKISFALLIYGLLVLFGREMPIYLESRELIEHSLPVTILFYLSLFYFVLRNITGVIHKIPLSLIILPSIFLFEDVFVHGLIFTTYHCLRKNVRTSSLFVSLSLMFFNLISTRFHMNYEDVNFVNGSLLLLLGLIEFNRSKKTVSCKDDLYFFMAVLGLAFSLQGYQMNVLGVCINLVFLIIALTFTHTSTIYVKYIITTTLIFAYISLENISILPFVGIIFLYLIRTIEIKPVTIRLSLSHKNLFKNLYLVLQISVFLGICIKFVIREPVSLICIPLVCRFVWDILQDQRYKENVSISEMISAGLLIISFGAIVL